MQIDLSSLGGSLLLSGRQPYHAVVSAEFQRAAGNHKELLKRLEALRDRICQAPYAPQSELLGRGKKVDLRGKRSWHMTGNFVVIYAVCEECVQQGFLQKRWNSCAGICDAEPQKRVVFLGFGKHDLAYGRDWQFRP